MSKQRLYLFDTTLRDGAQTPGVEFSLEDKINVLKMLDGLGIDYIEGGYPGANPLDTEFFETDHTEQAIFTAFGMTKRAGRSAANDPGIQALINSQAKAVCFVAKAWDYQITSALGISLEDNLVSITDSIKATLEAGKEAYIDCEHFFDGYKSNPAYALKCVETAIAAGARWVILCDTNGGTLPHEITEIISTLGKQVALDHIGIHAHNDCEQAVANSLAAVQAGVRHIQGTLNGIGERCGNANLISLIPTLMTKEPFASQFEVNVSAKQLASITHVSRAFDELLNRAPNKQAPYVGASAFATKAGIHASALLKDPKHYEHVVPDLVGNERNIMMSQQAGKSNLLATLQRHNIDADKNDPRLNDLLREVKEREAAGFAYDNAEASFILLAHKRLGMLPHFFKVNSYSVQVERQTTAQNKKIHTSKGQVILTVDGVQITNVADGDGPVNALDRAMRKDLGKYSKIIADLELVDYKVRILDGGTQAVTRVLIESRDGQGNRWTTIGVSNNIIEASFRALRESITYKLLMTTKAKSM